ELRAGPEDLQQRRTAIAGPESEAQAHQPVHALTGLAAAAGNRGFSRMVSRVREGEGILPTGLVHPDVQAAIAAASGGGRSLDPVIARDAGPRLGDSFGDVRVHHDDRAAALSRAVSARAFTVGSDVF